MVRARITPGDGDPRHGSANGYTNLGCRCERCRAAVAVAHREMMNRNPHLVVRHKIRQRKLRGVTNLDPSVDLRRTRAETDAQIALAFRQAIERGDIPSRQDVARWSGLGFETIRQRFPSNAAMYEACGYRLALVPIDLRSEMTA